MSTLRSRVEERLTLAGYRGGWAVVRALPEGAAYRIFDQVADATHRRGGRGVERLRANYARVRPELDAAELEELVQAGLRSYMRYWCDAFRLQTWSRDDLATRVRLVGDEDARRRLANGQGVVLFLGHLGNWDSCGAWSTLHFAPVTTVAERLRPEALFEQFLTFRESLGMTILPLTGGGSVFPRLAQALTDGGFVPLLADRDLTQHGVEVDLCGQRVKVAAGPAALALDTGAALYSLGVHYERRPSGGWAVVATFSERVEPPHEGTRAERIQVATQGCVDGLSRTIVEHTEDWHMMQRVFVDDLGVR